MKTTTKKGAKKSKAKPRAACAATSIAKLKKTIAAQALEICHGAEQQAAASDILRMIARASLTLYRIRFADGERVNGELKQWAMLARRSLAPPSRIQGEFTVL